MNCKPSAAPALAALISLACAAAISAQAEPVAVDGLYDDWQDVSPAWTDPQGDCASEGAVDFGGIWVHSSAERMTIRFQVGTEMNLQGGNAVTLLLDSDANAATGHQAEGVGAEFEWTFGERRGSVWSNEGVLVVGQHDVELRQAPTVSSTEFEISFLRKTGDGRAIAASPDVDLVLVAGKAGSADRLPDTAALRLRLSNEAATGPRPMSLERGHPDDIRVVTWNVLFDGLFKRPAPFIRVLRALDPDVICFQEIWAHTSQQAADMVSLALPGPTWYRAASGEGHIVSRHPMLLERSIDESGNYWALVDLPDERYDVDLSIVSAHPPCCDKEEERQRELDGIAAWLRELQTPGGILEPTDEPPLEFDLVAGTPIVVAGDMNLVGGASQVRTLTDGWISDEATFGPSHAADWDGTPLADAWPRVNGADDVFTWRDARSSFSPGKLDYIVYSDSVLELRRAFSLETTGLTGDDLARYGLKADDTLEASDHLPVVADFTPAVSQARTEAGE